MLLQFFFYHLFQSCSGQNIVSLIEINSRMLQYFTVPPHSRWNSHGTVLFHTFPHGFHIIPSGFQMDSMQFQVDSIHFHVDSIHFHVDSHVDSMQFQVDSIHFHVNSMHFQVDSIWIPYIFMWISMQFQVDSIWIPYISTWQYFTVPHWFQAEPVGTRRIQAELNNSRQFPGRSRQIQVESRFQLVPGGI